MKNAKMLLSVGVFTLALAGAFATSAKEAGNASLKSGYIKQNGHCVLKNTCETVNTGILCTETQTGGAQIFAMDQFGGCEVPVWRRPN